MFDLLVKQTEQPSFLDAEVEKVKRVIVVWQVWLFYLLKGSHIIWVLETPSE